MEKPVERHLLSPKKIALFLLYGLIALCLFFTVLSFNDLPSILAQLQTVDPTYVLIGVGMLLCYMAMYPLSLCILTRARRCPISTKLTYSIAMTEFFFNGITPLATGGQPFQAHSYSRAKVKLSESTGLLLTNLIIYMVVTTAYSLLGLFFFDTLTADVDPVWIPIIIVGYALNFMMMVIMIALGASKGLCRWLLKVIRRVCTWRLFRPFASKADGVQTYFEQVQDAFSDLVRHKRACALAFLTKIASFAFFYGSTYFILLSLHIPVDPSHFFLVLCGTSFAITAVGFIPTPGASGGVEGSASQVFKSIILFVSAGTLTVGDAPTVAAGVMLIWRLLSYYLVMAISLCFVIGNELYFARSKKHRTSQTSGH